MVKDLERWIENGRGKYVVADDVAGRTLLRWFPVDNGRKNCVGGQNKFSKIKISEV